MAESNEEPPQKKPKFDGGPMFDSLKSAFEFKSRHRRYFMSVMRFLKTLRGNLKSNVKIVKLILE